jgi:hypothetical protein
MSCTLSFSCIFECVRNVVDSYLLLDYFQLFPWSSALPTARLFQDTVLPPCAPSPSVLHGTFHNAHCTILAIGASSRYAPRTASLAQCEIGYGALGIVTHGVGLVSTCFIAPFHALFVFTPFSCALPSFVSCFGLGALGSYITCIIGYPVPWSEYRLCPPPSILFSLATLFSPFELVPPPSILFPLDILNSRRAPPVLCPSPRRPRQRRLRVQ